MKRAGWLGLWLWSAVGAWAHVGSPNAFFSGRAGPYPVLVVVRPPATLPGVAEVEVRLERPERVRAWARALYRGGAAEAEPPAEEAAAVAGEAGVYHRGVWLLRRGPYEVEIALEGTRGRGEVAIPLTSAATQSPAMPYGLGLVLGTLAAALAGGAAGLGGAAGGPRAAAAAGGAAGLALAGLGWRWQAMDADFRARALDRPVAVTASVAPDAGHWVLRLDSQAPATGPQWDALVTDHGHLLHLFLVEEGGAGAFAHLHPVRRSERAFEGVLPPLPAGRYQLFGELTFANGATQTLAAEVALPAPAAEVAQARLTAREEALCRTVQAPEENEARPQVLAADDAWQGGPRPAGAGGRAAVAPLPGGGSIVLQNAGDFVQDRETALRFSVLGPGGEAWPLRDYMGMAGHAVLYREGGAVFAHLHPGGSISMAAQRLYAGETASALAPETPGLEISFPYAFPQAGKYQIWAQFRTPSGVVTGAFVVQVRPVAK